MKNELTNNNDSIIEIDLLEIMAVLWKQLWMILLVGSITMLLRFTQSYLTTVPQYQSTTSIYILINREVDGGSMEVQSSQGLLADYKALISGRYVLEKVIEEEGLDLTYQQLQSKIRVTNQTDTKILLITVQDPNPKMAQKIADAIREGAAKHIQSVTRVEAVNTVDVADLPQTPSNPSHLERALIAGVIAMAVCAAIIIVFYLLDNTISTEDDVMKHLRLSTLATIPEQEDEKSQKEKYKKRLLPKPLMNLMKRKG